MHIHKCVVGMLNHLPAVQGTQQHQDDYWQLLCAVASTHHPSGD